MSSNIDFMHARQVFEEYLDHYDSKYLTEELGKEWIFATSSIKVYPCCRYSGGHLDACLDIVAKYHPDAEQIEKIEKMI